MNKPVNFQLAKLLKEKEISYEDMIINYFYSKPRSRMYGIDEEGRVYDIVNTPRKLYTSEDHGVYNLNNAYYAPTFADVVMWLYEKHKIWVEVIKTDLFNKFFFQIKRKDSTRLKNGDFNTPTEAYEAAIEYVLNNLYEKL